MKTVINFQCKMIFTPALRCWETINVNIEKVGNLISSGPYVVSYFSKKGLVTLKNKNDKELKKSITRRNWNSFLEIRMVSTNINISQRTKLIKVVMILSKILSAIFFRSTNLSAKSQSKTSRTARFQLKHQL